MSKTLLRRRSLIQQLGAAAFLATPVFRSVLAEAQSQSPLRLILVHLPGGVSYLSPGVTGRGILDSSWSYNKVLSPLKSLESDIVIFEDMSYPTAEVVTTFAEMDGHKAGRRCMFTGSTDQVSHELSTNPFGQSTSLDQLVANAIGMRTKFGSLNLGVLTERTLGESARWVCFNKGVPIEPVGDAASVFARLFPNATAPVPPSGQVPDPAATAEILSLRARGQSRLDQLKREVAAIQAIAGVDERQKLDLHLTALRELENSLPAAGTGGPVFQGAGCSAPNVGAPSPTDDLVGTGSAMNELLYQAVNCDLTRIATIQWLSSGDDTVMYPWLGVNQSHHQMEHGWVDAASTHAAYDKVQTWIVEQIGVLLKRLKDTPEGDGSMLDNSLVLVMSEMWGTHEHDPVIGLIAGKAGGAVRTGRSLNAARAPHNNMLLSVANTMGLNLTSLGDPMYCTGALSLG